jgi:hypothetical protein
VSNLPLPIPQIKWKWTSRWPVHQGSLLSMSSPWEAFLIVATLTQTNFQSVEKCPPNSVSPAASTFPQPDHVPRRQDLGVLSWTTVD